MSTFGLLPTYDFSPVFPAAGAPAPNSTPTQRVSARLSNASFIIVVSGTDRSIPTGPNTHPHTTNDGNRTNVDRSSRRRTRRDGLEALCPKPDYEMVSQLRVGRSHAPMSASGIPEASHHDRLSQIIAGYLHAARLGTAPDPAALISQHPDLAGPLKSFFAGSDATIPALDRPAAILNHPGIVPIFEVGQHHFGRPRAPRESCGVLPR